MTLKVNPVTLLASPLGEEGHEVAKGCTRVRMIMILLFYVLSPFAQGGRRLAVRTAMEHPIGALPRTPFPASRDFPSRGNEKIGGTGYCVTYDTDSQSRNVLASPLGEEGHEVAKGWTMVRMIMTLDVDVTAERRHYNTHRPQGDTTTLGAKGPVKLKNPPAAGRSILRTFPFTTFLHNPPPSGGHNPRGEAPSTFTL